MPRSNFPSAILKWLAAPVMAIALAGAAQAQPNRPVRIASSNWTETEMMVNIAKQVIETRLNTKVELVQTDAGPMFQAVARGDLDFMMMGWLPTTHAQYWARFKDQLVDLGSFYDATRIGWAVPDYVPKEELGSYEDLKKPEVRAKLKGLVQGIEPGGGLMVVSEKALTTYGLKDYTLVVASETAMLSALKRAYEQKQWILVTAWSPHWKFANWKLRYLDDPKNTFGGPEKIHTLASKKFQTDFPKIAAVVRNMKLQPADLEAALADVKASSASAAAAKFIKEHPALVEQWLKSGA